MSPGGVGGPGEAGVPRRAAPGPRREGEMRRAGCAGGMRRAGCGGQDAAHRYRHRHRHRHGRALAAPPDMAPGPPGWGWGWDAPFSPRDGEQPLPQAERPLRGSAAPVSPGPCHRTGLSALPGLWGKSWRLASAISGMKGEKCGKSGLWSGKASSGFKVQQLVSAWEFTCVVRNT